MTSLHSPNSSTRSARAKLRHGSFFPALLEPRRRIDRALWAVIMDVLRAWRQHPQGRRPGGGPGHRRRVSKSQVSRICAELDGAVTEFGERRLDHIDFPYVFVDATYVKAHDGARVVSKAIIVATDVAADGNREVLGLAVGDSEDKAFWTAFLRSLRAPAIRSADPGREADSMKGCLAPATDHDHHKPGEQHHERKHHPPSEDT